MYFLINMYTVYIYIYVCVRVCYMCAKSQVLDGTCSERLARLDVDGTGGTMRQHVPMIHHGFPSIWVNLITTSLRPNPGIMVSKGNHPQMAELFRLVKYFNLPRYIENNHPI